MEIKEKIEELKSVKKDDALNDYFKNLIEQESEKLEKRIFLGLSKIIYNNKDVLLRQTRHNQEDIKRVEAKVDKLLKLAEISMADETELQKQKEIEELENKLRELKGEN